MNVALDPEFAVAFPVVAVVAILGFAAGVAQRAVPRAPMIAAGAVLAGYALLLAVTSAWVAACPGCTSQVSYDSTRIVDLIAAAWWGGIALVGVLLLIWLGAGLSVLVDGFLRRTT